MSALSDRIDNIKLAWAGLTFGQKTSAVASVVVPTLVVTVLVILFMGGGDDNAPNVGRNLIQNQNVDTVRPPLGDGADEVAVEGRIAGDIARAQQSLSGGSSYMPSPDLRSSNIEQEPVQTESESEVQVQRPSRPQPQASYLDALRNQPVPQPPESETTTIEEVQPRSKASERLQQSMGGDRNDITNDQYSGLGREQYREYVDGEVARMAGIFSTRKTKLESLYSVVPSGELSVSGVPSLEKNELSGSGKTPTTSSSANSGRAGEAQSNSAMMQCMLCPGDRIVAKIDRDIDSRYTNNIELTLVQGRLDGAKVFGSFRMVNNEAILRSQSRLVLTTDNITQDRNVAQFPAVIVDLESGSQIIDQDVSNYTVAKFLALSSTSIARRWSDLTVANATTQRVSEDGQNVQQQQSLSDGAIWQASGGWAIAEFNDIARRWYNSAPVIKIPKDELVSIMIVEPVELGWIDYLEQGVDYL